MKGVSALEVYKIKIVGLLAHFKVPLHSKVQKTYSIPSISSIVGIIKEIYDIDLEKENFIFGYTIKHEGITREFTKVYKEFNCRKLKLTDSERFKGDNIYLENLINPELIIYVDMNKEIKLKEPIVLGKTNYLAKIINMHKGYFEKVKLIDKCGIGYNQLTALNIGTGMIERRNVLTKFKKEICAYDYITKLFRVNDEFEYDKFYDEKEKQNIFLWKWERGMLNEFR